MREEFENHKASSLINPQRSKALWRQSDLASGAFRAPLKKWVDYLDEFMTRYELYPSSGRAFVALSGGPDSVALGLFLLALKSRGKLRELTFLHVHHGLRAESEDEFHWVRTFAEKWELPLKTTRLSPETWKESGNFEARARKLRYAFLFQHCRGGDKLYLGHHLDDSFEWSIHQMLRTCDLQSTLGIPLINGRKTRPLMAFSKAHILRFLGLIGQDYCEDESNRDTGHARNYLRHHIIPKCHEFSPHYLKNYVSRSTVLAGKLGLLRSSSEVSALDWRNWATLRGENWVFSEPSKSSEVLRARSDEFKHALQKFSRLERGKFRGRFAQLVNSHKAKKGYPIGPYQFSGGVNVYVDWGSFFVTTRDEEHWKEVDEELAERLYKGEIITSQIPSGALQERSSFLKWLEKARIPFPFIILAVSGEGKNEKRQTRKLNSFLGPSLKEWKWLPQTSRALKENPSVCWWHVGNRFFDRLEKARKSHPGHSLWSSVCYYAIKLENR